MKPGYDALSIQKFLSSREVLEPFCNYLSRVIDPEPKGNDKIAKRSDLEYDNLAGEKPAQKAISLFNLLETASRLPELVFHLSAFWFEHFGGAPEGFAGLNEALFAAAMDFNRDKRTRQRSLEAFDQLAKAHEPFAKEWSASRETIEDSPLADELETLDQLVEHLADCRHLYEQAEACGGERRWLQARECYRQLETVQPGYRDVAKQLDRLSDERGFAHLVGILDAARTGCVYDDALPWPGGYPYPLFQRLGTSVTANSSMDEVEQALEQLSLKDVKASEKASLETLLESEEQRLFVDLFLFPFRPSEETVLSIERAFFAEGRLPEATAIEAQLPTDQAAVVLLLMGRPDAASAIWEKAQQEDPRDGRLAHCQGLLHLSRAHAAKSIKARAKHWRRAIAQWAVALADHAYWVRWGDQRSEKYQRGEPFTYAVIDNLGARLRGHLEELLGRAATGKGSELVGQLKRELAIELEAVRLAQHLGGIAYEPGRRAFFGPLWTAHFALQEAVAKQLAGIPPQAEPAVSRGALPPVEVQRRLRWYFSPLATAAILLEGPGADPRHSLAALEEVASGKVRTCSAPDCPVHGAERLPFVVCCPNVPESLVRNAAYDGFDDPRDELREDALQLAVEAHWCLAQAQVRQGKILDRGALEQEWQHLLTLAVHTRDPAKVRERLRYAVLAESGGASPAMHSPTKCAELDNPITLIEFSLAKLSVAGRPEEDQMLKTRLGEHLTHRAMHRLDDGDLLGAEADLQRTLAVAPHLHASRAHLAGLWAKLASGADRFVALDYVRKAEELIRDGQCNFPGVFDYSELLEWIRRSRENLIGQLDATTGTSPEARGWSLPPTIDNASNVARLHGQATFEMRDGRPARALEALEEALEIDPVDADTQMIAVDALLTHARKLSDQGDHDQALALVEQWQPRLPSQAGRLERQLQFLRFWPRLRPCLEAKAPPIAGGKILYELNDHHEVLLPFKAENTPEGRILVRAQVEGENLRFLAPLSGDSGIENVLSNLLRASREIVQFKVSSRQDSELYLQGTLPHRMLDPQWFILASLGLSEFANLSRDHLAELEKLRTWFRETRDSIGGWSDDSAYLAASGKSLKEYCRKRHLRLVRVTDVHYRLQANLGGRNTPVEMEAWPSGVRLAARLGKLRQDARRHETFRHLAVLNAGLALGKLALADDLEVVLSVELPYLDNQAAADSFTFLEKKVAELRSQLT